MFHYPAYQFIQHILGNKQAHIKPNNFSDSNLRNYLSSAPVIFQRAII